MSNTESAPSTPAKIEADKGAAAVIEETSGSWSGSDGNGASESKVDSHNGTSNSRRTLGSPQSEPMGSYSGRNSNTSMKPSVGLESENGVDRVISNTENCN